MRESVRVAIVSLALATGGAAAAQAAGGAGQPAAASLAQVDPAAMAALEASKAYLRSLKSFELRAQSTVDEVGEDGLKLEVVHRVRYEYRAPDRLLVDWRSDREARRIYFDGKKLTVYAPRLGYYASTAESGTVADVLTRVAQDHGLTFPLPDIFYWAASGAPAYEVRGAAHVGFARIAGVDTDHYVFRQDDVDWQVWIERGERPLPRKIVITDRTSPSQPKFSSLLQWNPDVDLPDSRFAFVAGEGAKAVTLGRVSKGEAAK